MINTKSRSTALCDRMYTDTRKQTAHMTSPRPKVNIFVIHAFRSITERHLFSYFNSIFWNILQTFILLLLSLLVLLHILLARIIVIVIITFLEFYFALHSIFMISKLLIMFIPLRRYFSPFPQKITACTLI